MKSVVFLIAMMCTALILCVACRPPAKQIVKADIGTQYEVIEIKGYTYYKGFRSFAPTPDTIKRCMKEVLEENN